MRIYFCECWLNTNTSNEPDIKIPFFMRVELGCVTECQLVL